MNPRAVDYVMAFTVIVMVVALIVVVNYSIGWFT